MVVNIRYILISIFVHIIVFSLFYLIFCVSYFNNIQKLSLISEGSAVCMNLVSNDNLNLNYKKKTVTTKKTELIDIEDNKSEINKNVEVEKLQQVKSSASDASGGTGSTISEAIPVVDNDDIINCSPPSYPSNSLALGEEGIVVVRILVDTQGNIISSKLQQTSGFKSLDNSVMRSLKMWAVKRVPPQKTWVEVSVEFFIK